MRRVDLAALLALSLVSGGTSVAAQNHPQERFWMLWERPFADASHCTVDRGCLAGSAFLSRLLSPRDLPAVRNFMQQDLSQVVNGALAGQPRGIGFCLPQEMTNGAQRGGPPGDAPPLDDFETRPLSERIEALRGLPGVGLDLTGLQAPPGAAETFGPDVHAAFVARLTSAGLHVVSPAEADALPGQPKLAIFFSFTQGDGACTYSYSVFASLSQTAVLTRDPAVKLSVGVWSRSGAKTAESEAEAILSVADAFAQDYALANALN